VRKDLATTWSNVLSEWVSEWVTSCCVEKLVGRSPEPTRDYPWESYSNTREWVSEWVSEWVYVWVTAWVYVWVSEWVSTCPWGSRCLLRVSGRPAAVTERVAVEHSTSSSRDSVTDWLYEYVSEWVSEWVSEYSMKVSQVISQWARVSELSLKKRAKWL
jgi:hypothetical protein